MQNPNGTAETITRRLDPAVAKVCSGSLEKFVDLIHGFNLHYPDTLEEYGLFPKHGKM